MVFEESFLHCILFRWGAISIAINYALWNWHEETCFYGNLKRRDFLFLILWNLSDKKWYLTLIPYIPALINYIRFPVVNRSIVLAKSKGKVHSYISRLISLLFVIFWSLSQPRLAETLVAGSWYHLEDNQGIEDLKSIFNPFILCFFRQSREEHILFDAFVRDSIMFMNVSALEAADSCPLPELWAIDEPKWNLFFVSFAFFIFPFRFPVYVIANPIKPLNRQPVCL